MSWFNREAYLKLADEKGVSASITALHHELRDLEFELFEGEKGYRPELMPDWDRGRTLSRELWQIHLDRAESKTT